MLSDPGVTFSITLIQNANEAPPRVCIQAMTHLSSSTDPHDLLSAGSGSRLRDQHGTSGRSGLSQRGERAHHPSINASDMRIFSLYDH